MNSKVGGAGSYAGVTSVLLVDDHPVARAGMKALLAAERDIHVVAEADDGLKAISLTAKHAPDVVVMDLALPHLGGVEASKQILQASPSSRVLAFSAHEDPAVARSLLAAGASGYFFKRSAGDELVRAVRVVAAGGTYVDAGLVDQLIGKTERWRSLANMQLASLSEREAEVLRLIARGHPSREMALALGLSPRTLETYKARAMSKLNLHTRAELIRYAVRCGWLRDA